jgi:hypothetical protein
MGRPRLPLDRIWGYLDRTGGPDSCWEYTKQRDRHGYGRMQTTGHSEVLAHRIAYELTHGSIPDGMQILHRCDNRPCCNPMHLYAGTHEENMRDRGERGRTFRGRHKDNSRRPRGERNPAAKVTAEQVTEIRKRYAAGGVTLLQLAREFGLSSPNTVWAIVHRTKWQEVA